MSFVLQDAMALLARTPKVLDICLRDLPESWTMRNEGDKTWNAYDVVGHLCHGERTDWIPRVRRILDHGESVPFERFDRFAQERESQGKSLGQLLDDFQELRAESLRQLSALKLTEADMARKGMHPILGGVTLGMLLASWPVHDMTHVHQVSRILGHQYREDVGPWTKFMGVLNCSGHGE